MSIGYSLMVIKCIQIATRSIAGSLQYLRSLSNLIHALRRGGGSDGVASWIEENLGSGAVTAEKFMGGSSWSSCYVYETASGKSFFVKLAMGKSAKEMFEGEALGLQAMHGKEHRYQG